MGSTHKPSPSYEQHDLVLPHPEPGPTCCCPAAAAMLNQSCGPGFASGLAPM